MRVLPVIDLMHGHVVRGIAGERENYRPIQSRLASDARPESIARAFAEHGFRECYVADLDAIAGGEPHWDAFADLVRSGLALWVDAGCAEQALANELAAFEVTGLGFKKILVGLESLESPEDLSKLAQCIGSDRMAFSLDLKRGHPLTRMAAWRELEPMEIAQRVCANGVRSLVILDLAAVGTHGGPATASLCEKLRKTAPEIELISGGGVRHVDDLRAFAAAGCDYALVASALHDGRITRQELCEYL